MKREELKQSYIEKLQLAMEEIIAESPRFQEIIEEIHDNGLEVSYGMSLMVYLRDREASIEVIEEQEQDTPELTFTEEDEAFLQSIGIEMG
ncbi:hypothetical protein ACFL27_03010 [candidate division CSSED10-310 bacterium]|uniref:Uncharacterized protein n=1 Tax=candidate division CSSED10-310 bacterium TaxID=2855610 RepID=A0ABV6YSJ0_UNCC1